jgi:hypothetical protein
MRLGMMSGLAHECVCASVFCERFRSSVLVLSRPRFVPPYAVDCTALAALCFLHLRQQRRWCRSITCNPSDSRPEWSRTSKPTATCRTWRSLYATHKPCMFRVCPATFIVCVPPTKLVRYIFRLHLSSLTPLVYHPSCLTALSHCPLSLPSLTALSHCPLSLPSLTVLSLSHCTLSLPSSPLPSHCPPTHRWVWLAYLWMEASPFPGPQAHSSQGYLP